MKTRALIATKSEPFYYNGKTMKNGDKFDAVSDSDAEVLVLAGSAKYKTPPPSAAEDVGEPVQPEAASTPRRYKRRDMQAEG